VPAWPYIRKYRKNKHFEHWHNLCFNKTTTRTTPPVFAFELAATRFQALAAFFSPVLGDAGRNPLIRKEMAQNKPFSRISPVNKF
jgi:hypothetical protein